MELREQATALGLDEHGTFLGWIGDDVLHSLYRIADLTVVPSIYEPFGLVALEAMASGCPCLVADTGGLREVVPNENVGLRFHSRDPKSLGQMAERLLTDAALRDRLVAEASEHVLTFDWADVARQAAGLYGEVLAASARVPLSGGAEAGGIAIAAAARPVTDGGARSLPGLAGLALLAGFAAPAAAAPAIHAHRGGAVLDGVPSFGENTLSAFRNASRQGYVLEMDAKLTRDRRSCRVPRPGAGAGDRVHGCGGRPDPGRAALLPRRRPRQPRGWSGQQAGATAPEPIPTLAEVLAFARDEGAYVNLEIKNQPGDSDFDSGDAFAADVMKVVGASGLPKERLIVQSFYPRNLDVAKRVLSGVETSLLTLSPLNPGAPNFASSAGYEWVSPEWPVSGDFVDQAHGLDRKVVPFTLNTAADIAGAAGVGVDALITDDPALGQRTLGLTRTQLAPDTIRPEAHVRAPRYASDTGRGPRFVMRISGEDRGSGVAGLTLETRRDSNRQHALAAPSRGRHGPARCATPGGRGIPTASASAPATASATSAATRTQAPPFPSTTAHRACASR